MIGQRGLAAGVAVVALALLGGCAESAEDLARQDAREKAETISREVLGIRAIVWKAEELGRRAAARDDLALLRVAGSDVQAAEGVTLTVRVAGHGAETDFYGEPDRTVDVEVCYDMHFKGIHEPGPVERTDCPDGPPIVYDPLPPAPQLPTIEQLKAALPNVAAGGVADEAEVRAALARLALDPRVRIDVASRNGEVGLTLLARDEEQHTKDCRFAHVKPGATLVWRPATVQLQPGELSCAADEALRELGVQPPH